MKKNNVIELVQPGEFKDHLTEVLRQGAQALVLQAVEAEFAGFLETHSAEKLEDGRKRVVRHGHLPERKIVTKSWIVGTHHGVEAKYLNRYLAEYTFRFNRRHDPDSLFFRALGACVHAKPTTTQVL